MSEKIITRITSSLEKALIDTRPEEYPVLERQSCLTGETVDFQLLVLDTDGSIPTSRRLTVSVSGMPGDYSVREAVSVLCDLPTYSHDTSRGTPYYTESRTGAYPDVLRQIDGGKYIRPVPGRTTSLWFTLTPQTAGQHSISVTLYDGETAVSENTLLLTVIPAELPEQRLIFTQWFHCDCLASYYNVPVFSERHWEIISEYMKCASKNGMNCILTPILTPPLDTEIGGERPTVQLISVKVTDNGYEFGFELLDRWIETAQNCGMKYFEISHLFSQWGAEFAPKVVAEKNGKTVRIFGWDTPGTGVEYTEFVSSMLPKLVKHLKDIGIADRCIFHISDEPNLDQLDGYVRAKSIVSPYLDGLKVADALSSVEFYKSGAVALPIPSNDHIEAFIEAGVPERWTYYCCGQWDKVGNRFIAYPSSRNRILGVQLYKFDIRGFLQWGYNFWYSMGSRRLIDPYICQSADAQVPSGDPFSVYPSPDGTPLESLRQDVFREAILDISALELCERYIGRDAVIALIDDTAGYDLTFSHYPSEPEFILCLREKINAIIADHCKK